MTRLLNELTTCLFIGFGLGFGLRFGSATFDIWAGMARLLAAIAAMHTGGSTGVAL